MKKQKKAKNNKNIVLKSIQNLRQKKKVILGLLLIIPLILVSACASQDEPDLRSAAPDAAEMIEEDLKNLMQKDDMDSVMKEFQVGLDNIQKEIKSLKVSLEQCQALAEVKPDEKNEAEKKEDKKDLEAKEKELTEAEKELKKTEEELKKSEAESKKTEEELKKAEEEAKKTEAALKTAEKEKAETEKENKDLQAQYAEGQIELTGIKYEDSYYDQAKETVDKQAATVDEAVKEAADALDLL